MDSTTRSLLEKAIQLKDTNKNESFSHLVRALKRDGDWKFHYDQLFITLTQAFTEELFETGKIEEFFKCYEEALEVFPENGHLKYSLSKRLLDMGFNFKAFIFMNAAVKTNPEEAVWSNDLDQVKNSLVSQWHFRMLNDFNRNNAYRQAILKRVSGKSSVLDIGCGTGILSMLALERNPKRLIAVDYNEALCSVANTALSDNGIDTVEVKNCVSTSLTAEDIMGRVSVVITEIFDGGFFGEGVLDTMIHARKFLMENLETDVVIPESASLFICGLQSNILKRKFCVENSFLNNIFKLANFVVHEDSEEYYDTEDLTKIADLQYITEASNFLNVNFLDVEHMERLCNNEILKCKICCKQKGVLDAFAVWFQLNLCVDVNLTTDPRSEHRASAWEQAVIHLKQPLFVHEDTKLDIELSCASGKLRLLRIIDCQPMNSLVNFVPVPSYVVRILNDSKFVKKCDMSAGAVCVYLSQMFNLEETKLVDLSTFPIMGILLLIRGVYSLSCYVDSYAVRNLILKMLIYYRINPENINFIDKKSDIDGNNVRTYNVFVNLLLDNNNNLPKKETDQYLSVKRCVYNYNGLMIPNRIRMIGRLIYSDELERTNHVKNSNVFDYKIAESMNIFSVSHNRVSDISTVPFVDMSRDVVIYDQVIGNFKNVMVDVEFIKSGKFNAVMCWFEIQLLEKGDYVSTLGPDSFLDTYFIILEGDLQAKVTNIPGVLLVCVHDNKFNMSVHLPS